MPKWVSFIGKPGTTHQKLLIIPQALPLVSLHHCLLVEQSVGKDI